MKVLLKNEVIMPNLMGHEIMVVCNVLVPPQACG